MNLFQKRITQIKALQMVSSWQPMKRLTYGGTALVPVAVPTSWRKCLSMNERLLFNKCIQQLPQDHHTCRVLQDFHKPLSLKQRFPTFHYRTSSLLCSDFSSLEPSKLLKSKFIFSPPRKRS